jgi:excisionase family DNA binding protein
MAIGSMMLSELRKRLQDRIADADAMNATAPVADVLRVVLDELQETAGTPTAPREEADCLLTVPELAVRMKVKQRYVYDHHREWPFTRRIGRSLRFSERGLEQWMKT